jgi:UDP-glucose 4-epimerase
MQVWGNDYDTRDGSCVRDYIHVSDIAHAHTLALNYLLEGRNKTNCDIFNLGSGNGNTVLEVINSFERISGQKLNYAIGPRRAGDVIAIYANNDKAVTELKWKPEYGLDEMLRTAWNWEKKLNGVKKAEEKN